MESKMLNGKVAIITGASYGPHRPGAGPSGLQRCIPVNKFFDNQDTTKIKRIYGGISYG